MMQISEAESVAARAQVQIAADAAANPHVDPAFNPRELRDALVDSPDTAWVLDRGHGIVGHLYGALVDQGGSAGVWTGPDGYSFEDPLALRALVEMASHSWRSRGAHEHFVWCADRPQRVDPWFELGYSRFSTRGSLVLADRDARRLPEQYSVRRGEARDLEMVFALDDQLSAAQGDDPEQRTVDERNAARLEIVETLEDPETNHFVVEFDQRVIGQCISFPAPVRRGSFVNTIFLSEVVIDQGHRRRGVARCLIDEVLTHARSEGFNYCETQWRTSNVEASRFWIRYGFTPTYARLRRTL